MPWKESSTMSQRQEFVMLASADNANIRQLCRRFGISPTIGYKWLGRYQTDGLAGLKDQSRRPKNSPRRSSDKVEQAVVKLRQKHPTWGGRKLCARLKALKEPEVPSASTITAILHRHQLITPEATEQHNHISALNIHTQTTFGRWISKVISHWRKGVVSRSPCS